MSGDLSDGNIMTWWLMNGLKPTLINYGVDVTSGMWNPIGWAEEFRKVVPETHKEFIKQLPLCWENETHFACHAYMRAYEPLPRERDKLSIPETQKEEVLWERFTSMWIQNPNKDPVMWDKIGVFGHTPVSSYSAVAPIKMDRIRLIDTGAFDGGYLCAYNTSVDDWILQATDEKDLEK